MEEPVCVVGDIHGQYYDFLHMLKKAGTPEKIKQFCYLSVRYVYLGDYVDRGMFSIEVVILLYCLKVIELFKNLDEFS